MMQIDGETYTFMIWNNQPSENVYKLYFNFKKSALQYCDGFLLYKNANQP